MFFCVVYVSDLSYRMLKWLRLQMTASAVWLSVPPPCQETSSLEDPGPTMWVIHSIIIMLNSSRLCDLVKIMDDRIHLCTVGYRSRRIPSPGLSSMKDYFCTRSWLDSMLLSKHSLTMWYHLSLGPVLGGSGQWADCPQSPTDAHRSSAGCMLERCKAHRTKQFKLCSRCYLSGHGIIYDVLLTLTRMGVKSSLLLAIKQPRCGILTAIKHCRLHRLDENSQINYMVIRMKQNHLTPLTISLHSMTVRSNQSTG